MDQPRLVRYKLRVVAADASIVGPLASFYVAAGRTLPVVATVDDGAVPDPVAALLRPASPLTPRLEQRHGEPLALRVLERRRDGDRYARCVVLVRGDGVPVVLGAIEIDLGRLPAVMRAAVLAENVPFGHIFATAHAAPDALLKVTCDAWIGEALGLNDHGGWLYGRRRTLVDERGAVVATIVEILAPASEMLAPAAEILAPSSNVVDPASDGDGVARSRR